MFRQLVLSKYYYINWLPFWTPQDRPKSFTIGNSVERGNPVFSPEVVRQVKPRGILMEMRE